MAAANKNLAEPASTDAMSPRSAARLDPSISFPHSSQSQLLLAVSRDGSRSITAEIIHLLHSKLSFLHSTVIQLPLTALSRHTPGA